MDRIESTRLRDTLADTIDRVRFTGDRIIIRKRGKEVAAIVSLQDLAVIEELEDAIDRSKARTILADPKERRISLESVTKALAARSAPRTTRGTSKPAARRKRAGR
jgi:prevent-host-death family protein